LSVKEGRKEEGEKEGVKGEGEREGKKGKKGRGSGGGSQEREWNEMGENEAGWSLSLPFIQPCLLMRRLHPSFAMSSSPKAWSLDMGPSSIYVWGLILGSYLRVGCLILSCSHCVAISSWSSLIGVVA
jgi:hypothetical protein